ncbi:MAG: hypothetical protein IT323_14375, partial [Anaerolineae bacterium]|nr:hypothetical protein [Anaerolineae bacterium]
VVDDLGSRRDVEYVRTILAQGTSADRQLATYFTALDDGCTEEQAQVLVMDRIISETVQGIEG